MPKRRGSPFVPNEGAKMNIGTWRCCHNGGTGAGGATCVIGRVDTPANVHTPPEAAQIDGIRHPSKVSRAGSDNVPLPSTTPNRRGP
jgi:hypothetical protein